MSFFIMMSDDANKQSGAEESIDLGPKKISLCYDPTRTKKEDLLQLIEQAGGKLKQVESESSPLL